MLIDQLFFDVISCQLFEHDVQEDSYKVDLLEGNQVYVYYTAENEEWIVSSFTHHSQEVSLQHHWLVRSNSGNSVR